MVKRKLAFKLFINHRIKEIILRIQNFFSILVNNNRQSVRGFPDKLDCVPMVYGSAESALYLENRFRCITDIYLPQTGLKLPPEKDIGKDVLVSSAPEVESESEAEKRGRKKKNGAKNPNEEETNESLKEKFPKSRVSQ